MSKVTRILVTASLSLMLSACGQKGDLAYPPAPGGTRASLGQSLVPTLPSTAASAPASGATTAPTFNVAGTATPPLPLPGR